jgi:amino-acid N-acetyltransferase
MSTSTYAGIWIEPATPDDLPAISRLLTEAALPRDGIEAAFELGVVARDPGGRVLGAAAVERHGTSGVLRSVVVDPSLRGTGVGAALVRAAEAAASAVGIDRVYLLTETAGSWFPRLGYRVIARDDVPASVLASIEWAELCAATAVAMRHDLE